MKQVSQIKHGLGQGRAGVRCKIKILIPTLSNNPIVQVTEKYPKVLVPKTPKIQDTVLPIPSYGIQHIKLKDDSGSRIVERKAVQDVSREIPIYPDPVYRPPSQTSNQDSWKFIRH